MVGLEIIIIMYNNFPIIAILPMLEIILDIHRLTQLPNSANCLRGPILFLKTSVNKIIENESEQWLDVLGAIRIICHIFAWMVEAIY